MQHPDQKPEPESNQDNIGYENTEVSNIQDDQENRRLQANIPGQGEAPVENKEDSAGLRSESGKKSLGKESGNTEQA